MPSIVTQQISVSYQTCNDNNKIITWGSVPFWTEAFAMASVPSFGNVLSISVTLKHGSSDWSAA